MYNFLINVLYGNLSPNYDQVVELINQRQKQEIIRMDLSNLTMDDLLDLLLNCKIEASKQHDTYYREIGAILLEKVLSSSGISLSFLLKKLESLSASEKALDASTLIIDLLKRSYRTPIISLENGLKSAAVNAIRINQPEVLVNIVTFGFSLSLDMGRSLLQHTFESLDLQLSNRVQEVDAAPIQNLLWKRTFEFALDLQPERKKQRTETDFDSDESMEEATENTVQGLSNNNKRGYNLF